jgi:hypothetical protein
MKFIYVTYFENYTGARLPLHAFYSKKLALKHSNDIEEFIDIESYKFLEEQNRKLEQLIENLREIEK